MRYWNSCRGLLSFTVLLVLVFSLALVGCSNTGGNTATVNGTVGLTATNAAALGGLIFPFTDATAQSIGLPDNPQQGGVWLMNAGTARPSFSRMRGP